MSYHSVALHDEAQDKDYSQSCRVPLIAIFAMRLGQLILKRMTEQ